MAQHEIRAVDAVGEPVAQRAQRPDERLAVGDDEVGAEHRVHGLGVLLGDHDGVRRGDADVACAARGDHPVHPVQRAVVVDDGDRDAEHLDGCRSGGRADDARLAGLLERGRRGVDGDGHRWVLTALHR